MLPQWTLALAAVYAVYAVCVIGDANEFHGRAANSALWTPPDGRTREEWLACNGLPADSCRRMPDKMATLTKLLYGPDYKPTPAKSAVPVLNTPDGCILLTEEQIDELIQRARRKMSSDITRSRSKRKVMDFETHPSNKWPLPIVYKFDGTHNTTEQEITRDAIQIWKNNTCLRFQEITTGSSHADHHIVFTKPNSGGCSSYVGRVSYIPQPINLAEGCLSKFRVPGTPVHEIGHAVGFHHEQSRADRDNHVLVLKENIIPERYSVNYVKEETMDVVPYSFGSVMHYYDGAFAINSSLHTLQAINQLYQLNMGQRSELSYYDIKAINIAYNCDSAMCSSSPAVNCERGGYRDPNNCGRCKCPDGFGGDFCERVADPVNAVCGGTFVLNATDQLTIKSPGYDSPGYYGEMLECSWLIHSSSNHGLRLQFVGTFSIIYPSSERGCYWHWVEVKYKSDLGLDGARFCGPVAPSVNITSELSEMLVVFRTNFESGYKYRGFQAVVTAGDPVATTTTTTTTTSTSTTTTTTTTSATTTTTTPGTITNRPSSATTTTTTTSQPSVYPTTPTTSTTTTSSSTRKPTTTSQLSATSTTAKSVATRKLTSSHLLFIGLLINGILYQQ